MTARPNILLVVADDPAYAGDVDRLTDALDRLARELGDTIPHPTTTTP